MDDRLQHTAVLVTTEPGLEQVLLEELALRIQDAGQPPVVCKTQPFGMRGTIRIDSPSSMEELWQVFTKTRTVYHVHQLLHVGKGEPKRLLEDVKEAIRTTEFVKLSGGESFRVSCRRSGKHTFSSYDVLRECGAIIQEKNNNPVNLSQFEVHIRVDIIDSHFWIGYQHTSELLSDRFVKIYLRKYTLKPAMAFALLSFSGIKREQPGRLLDPFCGSCTISIEAAYWFNNVQCYASDLHSEVIEGAKQNVAALNLENKIDLRIADARKLSNYYGEEKFDAIVANPPFGLRMGRNLNLYWFYHNFLEHAMPLLCPKGRIVLLLHRSGLFRSVVADFPQLEIVVDQGVEAGGKHLRIFALAFAKEEIT